MRLLLLALLGLLVACTTPVDDDDSTVDDDDSGDDDDSTSGDDDDSTSGDDDDSTSGDFPSQYPFDVGPCADFALWDDPAFGCALDWSKDDLCPDEQQAPDLEPSSRPYCPPHQAILDEAGWLAVTMPGLADLSPADPVDYLELREYPYAAPDATDSEIDASTGAVCAGAQDQSACLSAYDAAVAAGLGELGPGMAPFDEGRHHALIWTRGDAVGTVATHAELRAFLAPLDLDDATFATLMWGARIEGPLSWARAAGDAQEVAAHTIVWTGPVRYDSVVVRFATNGEACIARAAVDTLWCDSCF